jgi:hypothetical protein
MFEKHAFKITASANFAPKDANDCTLMMRFQNKDDRSSRSTCIPIGMLSEGLTSRRATCGTGRGGLARVVAR